MCFRFEYLYYSAEEKVMEATKFPYLRLILTISPSLLKWSVFFLLYENGIRTGKIGTGGKTQNIVNRRRSLVYVPFLLLFPEIAERLFILLTHNHAENGYSSRDVAVLHNAQASFTGTLPKKHRGQEIPWLSFLQTCAT
jgi:hypothetical protein